MNHNTKSLVKKILLCSALIIIVGCNTLQPGADPLIVRAEQTESIGASTFTLILSLDNDNRPFWRTNAPAFHEFCEWLRQPVTTGGRTVPRDIAMILDLNDVKAAYRASKSQSNALYSAITTFSTVLTKANGWLAVVTNTPGK